MNFRRVPMSLVLMAVTLMPLRGYAAADKDEADYSVPGCFVSDTVYHAMIDLKRSQVEISYGALPLVSVHYTACDDAKDIAAFAAKWNRETKSSWQTTTGRHVWAGRSQVSDTVIRIVSEVASVDPIRIQRLLPDRFELELTDGFRLRIMTPAGYAAPKDFGEKWHEFKDWLNPFKRTTVLAIVVSPEDAQTLYYALEPGTPLLVFPEESAK